MFGEEFVHMSKLQIIGVALSASFCASPYVIAQLTAGAGASFVAYCHDDIEK
jgi:hypothetical protein